MSFKYGSAVGHDLTGGWHDCGTILKYQAVGYALRIITTYLVYEDKAEDRWQFL